MKYSALALSVCLSAFAGTAQAQTEINIGLI